MDHLSPFRKYFRWAALACTTASAVLTAWFGLNQSPYLILALFLAAFLVACSIASDYINLFVYDAFKARNWGMLTIFGMGAVFVFSLNLLSNLGSVGWQKEVVSTEARVQNTKYSDQRDGVAKAQASYDSAKRQLDALLTANGWSASANAVALRSMLKEKQEAADREAARVRCGPKCEVLKADVVKLTEQLGTIERRTDLSDRIAAAERVLAKAKAKAAEEKVSVAAPDVQARFFASMVGLDLKPSETAQTWTGRGMSVWLALGLCIAPILFSLIGWKSETAPAGNRKDASPVLAPRREPAPTVTALEPKPEGAMTVVLNQSDSHFQRMRELLGEALASTPQPRAA